MEEAIVLLSWLRESSASNFKAPSKQDVIFFCHVKPNLRNYQDSNPDPHSYNCRTFTLGQRDFLRWKLVFAQSIYSLKLQIAHSGPGNLSGDTTVYITTHEHLIKYVRGNSSSITIFHFLRHSDSRTDDNWPATGYPGRNLTPATYKLYHLPEISNY